MHHESEVNVTQRAGAESAPREDGEAARALLNASPDEAVLVDREGVILASNQQLASRLRRTVDELSGVCLHDLVPAEVAHARRQRAEEVVRSGEPLRFESPREGGWVEVCVCPVKDARGPMAAGGSIHAD
jgi:PAS domain-containing protein